MPNFTVFNLCVAAEFCHNKAKRNSLFLGAIKVNTAFILAPLDLVGNSRGERSIEARRAEYRRL